jgi:hypothetical protein
MVAIVKELKRNGEGQQWFDTEVFYSKRDATAYMTKKVETHIKEGFTLKTSKELHRYLLDEEQGDELEYMVEEKRIHGTPTEHPFHEDISFNMNQILPNGWKQNGLMSERVEDSSLYLNDLLVKAESRT